MSLDRNQKCKYYEDYYPYNSLAKWLTYSQDCIGLDKREFSWSIRNDSVFLRHLSYPTVEAWKDIFTKNKSDVPPKLDIGANFSLPPCEMSKTDSNAYYAQERELVFDIDMDDYDSIRSCCSGANICSKCWQFIACACTVLDEILKKQFGFKNLLYIFSGRRGIHVWVADRSARQLNDEQRAALISYVTLSSTSTVSNLRFKLPLLNYAKDDNIISEPHPDFLPLLRICVEYLTEGPNNILATQQPISTSPSNIDNHTLISTVISQVSQAAKPIKQAILEEATNIWNSLPEKMKLVTNDNEENSKKLPSNEKEVVVPSETIFTIICNALGQHNKPTFSTLHSLILELTYPRLDINVSKTTGHLLKSPFSLHPKTGNVCVPLDIKSIKTWDIKTMCPTMESVVNNETGTRALEPYIDRLNNFVNEVLACEAAWYRELRSNHSGISVL